MSKDLTKDRVVVVIGLNGNVVEVYHNNRNATVTVLDMSDYTKRIASDTTYGGHKHVFTGESRDEFQDALDSETEQLHQVL